jgi:hypothetical protein
MRPGMIGHCRFHTIDLRKLLQHGSKSGTSTEATDRASRQTFDIEDEIRDYV